MAQTYVQILNYGTQAAYEALETKNPNLLYFCQDTGKIFKGAVDFTNHVVIAASKPVTPVAGKIYFLADTNTVEVYVNDAWKVISYPTTTTVDVNSDDSHVATAKAVYDAIMKAVENVVGADSTISAIEAGEQAGTVKVTKGDGSTETVRINGVVTKPTWDAEARKLTIPVTGEADVVINFGKDIFIDPTANNGYSEATGNIELYLNDGTEGKEPTKISIPASALIDVYTGTTSNGTSVTVGDDNTIKVDLVLDPDSNNALTLTAAGLKVDLSAYAKTTDVTSAVSAVQNNVATLEQTVSGHTTRLAGIDSSITALQNADTSLEGRVTVLEGKVQENTENITALATAATTWGTF